MCRSTRLTLFILAIAISPSAALAQFYGFPSEVGVIDDGFGVLPPLPPAPPPLPDGFADGPPPPFLAGSPSAPPPCPLVIKIGRGSPRTKGPRVTYGSPTCP